MGELSRADLEAFFETDDKPTQAQFADFIESYGNIVDDGPYVPDKTTVLTAAVKTLNSIPVQLVASPGPTKAIIPITMWCRITFNTTQYPLGATLRILHTSATTETFNQPDILRATVTTFRQFQQFVTLFATTDTMIIEDAPLLLTSNADFVTGDSDIDVYLLYRILTV